MKKLLLTLLMMAGVSAAQAQVTGNLGLTTDYRFRGISQTQNGLAIQGGVDYAHASGFYVGNWNSSVSSELFNRGSGIESDLYAGFKKEVAKGVTLDIGTMNYFYSKSSNPNGPAFTTNELYAGVTYGPVTGKISYALSNYFGLANSDGTVYYQADVNYPLAKDIVGNFHIGRTDIKNHNDLDYTDIKVGATYNLSGWMVGGHFYTNKNKGSNFSTFNTVSGEKLYKNTFVISVAKSF
jgi:uncharacterized protein (TIGR02001 family)